MENLKICGRRFIMAGEKIITTEMISNYMFMGLIKLGHVPSENELEDIADVFFDFLIDHDIMEEHVEGE